MWRVFAGRCYSRGHYEPRISPFSHPAQDPSWAPAARHSIGRVWTSTSDGQKTCDACGTILSTEQLLMEGTTLAPGGRPIHFHARCFQLWDQEIRPPSNCG